MNLGQFQLVNNLFMCDELVYTMVVRTAIPYGATTVLCKSTFVTVQQHYTLAYPKSHEKYTSPVCNPEVLTAVSLVCNKLSSNRNCSPIVWNQLCFSFMYIVFIWDPKVRPRLILKL